MDVLVLAKAFPPNLGGVEAVSEEIAAAYARAGATVRVVTQFGGQVGEDVRTVSDGTFRVVNVGPGTQFAVFLRMLRVVRYFLSEKPVDVTHATTWRVLIPAIIARILGARVGKLVVMVHGREILQTHGAMTLLMRLVFSWAHRAIIISNYSKNSCQEKLPVLRKIGVVSWNGLSWPREQPKRDYRIADGSPISLLAASQHTKRKNIAVAISAVSILARRHAINAHLTVAGDGPERSQLEQLSRSLGLESQVTFLGKLDRHTLPDRYRSADIFVHPHSHSHDSTDVETFCLAVADGMGLGVPVISGRDGAPAEYIANGVNGFLVDGEDADKIADLIANIVSMSPEERGAIGREAAAFCGQAFSWDRHIVPVLECFPEFRIQRSAQ